MRFNLRKSMVETRNFPMDQSDSSTSSSSLILGVSTTKITFLHTLTNKTDKDGEILSIPPPPGPDQHQQQQSQSVTAVLTYCKRKILNPYLRLLKLTGLRPIFVTGDANRWRSCCSHSVNCLYVSIVLTFLIIGYILQYVTCYRRDRGFLYTTTPSTSTYRQICHRPVIFTSITPSILHFTGYLLAVLTIRHNSTDDDQLTMLMEKVYLSSTGLPHGLLCQRRLIRQLWWFVTGGALWLIAQLLHITYMVVYGGAISFIWFNQNTLPKQHVLKALLMVCTEVQDLVQVTVILNYCLQTQLLKEFLAFLCQKLVQAPVQPLNWVRDIEDFRKMLNYVNNQVAPSVTILTVLNVVCCLTGALWLMHFDRIDVVTRTVPNSDTIGFVNFALWLVIAFAPFIQAARLSNACQQLRNVSQQVRIQSFVIQSDYNDTILTYTSDLKLYAKLCFTPITPKYLYMCTICVIVIILVLGQCHFLNMH